MSLAAEIVKEFSPDLLPAIIEQLSPEEQAELHAHLEADQHDDIIARCSERVVAHDRGPMWWLRKHTKTTNFHWDKQGLPPKAPFPYKPYPPELLASYNVPAERLEWDYLDWVMSYLLLSYETGKPLNIPKTREMMTSYTVVGYCGWMCQFFPNIEAVGQSEKDDKAKGLVAYANALYENQPEWLKARNPLARGDVGTQHEICWANGSKFIAVPQGERQTASHHPTIYFNDESAHQPAWKSTVDIVRPVAKQIISVSSAAFSDFGIACEQPTGAV
jgi:hypothetical protein